jgi:hypothetical protein
MTGRTARCLWNGTSLVFTDSFANFLVVIHATTVPESCCQHFVHFQYSLPDFEAKLNANVLLLPQKIANIIQLTQQYTPINKKCRVLWMQNLLDWLRRQWCYGTRWQKAVLCAVLGSSSKFGNVPICLCTCYICCCIPWASLVWHYLYLLISYTYLFLHF